MENPVNPKKLLHSKWTATLPVDKQKHFIVVAVEYDEEQRVISCELQAVMSKKVEEIDWRCLKDSDAWQQGWK